MLPDLASHAERVRNRGPADHAVGDEYMIVYTGFSTRRAARLPGHDARFPLVRAARRDHAPGGQGRRALSAPVRRTLGADPPAECPATPRTTSPHLAVLEPRPPPLGRPHSPASRPRGRLVGRAQDRALRAAARDPARLAAPLPRRPHDRGRIDLPARSGPPRPRPPRPGACPLDRMAVRAGAPYERIGDVDQVVFPAAGGCSTTATRSGCTTAPQTPRSASRPRAFRRLLGWLSRHSS